MYIPWINWSLIFFLGEFNYCHLRHAQNIYVFFYDEKISERKNIVSIKYIYIYIISRFWNYIYCISIFLRKISWTLLLDMEENLVYMFHVYILLNRSGLKGVCGLLPILGLTWVFGIFSVNQDLIIFQYLFAVFNSLQVNYSADNVLFCQF